MIQGFEQNQFNGAPTGIVVWAGNGAFSRVNDTFSSITGYSQEELLTLDWHGVTHPEDWAQVAKLFDSVFTGSGAVVGEHRCLRKDGGVRWLRSCNLRPPGAAPPGHVAISIIEDLTPQRRAEEAREKAVAALRRLAGAIHSAEEAERRRIGREVHDGTAQSLAALSMTLGAMKEANIPPKRKEELLDEALELIEQCNREIRSLACLLQPPLVDRVGLAAAVESWVGEFSRRSGIAIETLIQDGPRLGADVERALFRMLQEALANVYRHSGSAVAAVTLRYDSGAVLEVVDRGRGLSSSTAAGAGLAGLRERAELAGGSLEITSGATGTKVTARIPIQS